MKSSSSLFAWCVCVHAAGVKIPELENKIQDYFDEMSSFREANSLLILASKSSVILFTPETKQAKTHPIVKIDNTKLPLNRCQNILGAYLDTTISFNVHYQQVATRLKKRINLDRLPNRLPLSAATSLVTRAS